MLEPAQFSVNEAWIVFRLNDAPVVTLDDGDFNVICLMDAASLYILGSEFVPVSLSVIPRSVAERLVEAGRSQARQLPEKLLVSEEFDSRHFVTLANQRGIEVERVPDDHLAPFVSEAREGFEAHIGGGRIH